MANTQLQDVDSHDILASSMNVIRQVSIRISKLDKTCYRIVINSWVKKN